MCPDAKAWIELHWILVCPWQRVRGSETTGYGDLGNPQQPNAHFRVKGSECLRASGGVDSYNVCSVEGFYTYTYGLSSGVAMVRIVCKRVMLKAPTFKR